MEMQTHNLTALFSQLGLSTEPQAMQQFIRTHQIFSDTVELSDATFWSASQAAFLREALQLDSDWAEVVDELNSRLHTH